jgi:formylglycine-generating enzyme
MAGSMTTSMRCSRRAVWLLVLAACGSGSPSAGGDGGAGNDGDSGGVGPGPAASCTGLPATCGPSGNDGCCNSPQVVGGTYYRGNDVAGDPNSGDQTSPATIGSFRLDKYEVTVGRFRAFVLAGMGMQSGPPATGAGAHARISWSGWDPGWNPWLVPDRAALLAAIKCNATYQTWTDAPGANEVRPMNCVSWYEAQAFCAWDGGYLPTDAEWNYAAAGGDQQRAYPWSNPPSSLTADGSYASYLNGTNCQGDGLPGCALTDLVLVGTKPSGDGRWGQSDLAGNVTEWTLDWFSVYPNPCADCANLTVASERVLHGGSFGQSAFYMRMRSRSPLSPMSRSPGVGIRCARAL